MGAIPTFNCMTGTIIPITKNGQPVTSRTQGEDCENPVQLAIGSSQCVPYSRFLRIPTGNPNVETTVICRKYEEDDHGPSDNKFTDIAAIQHNKATGNTCFFQSKLYQHLEGTAVPSPQGTLPTQASIGTSRVAAVRIIFAARGATMPARLSGLSTLSRWRIPITGIPLATFARRPSSVHFGHPVPEMHSVSPRLIPFAATVLRSGTLRGYRSRVPSLNDFTPSI